MDVGPCKEVETGIVTELDRLARGLGQLEAVCNELILSVEVVTRPEEPKPCTDLKECTPTTKLAEVVRDMSHKVENLYTRIPAGG